MRTLIDIPDDDIEKLDTLAAKRKQSRAAAIREAVILYLARNSNNDWIDRGYGHWSDRADIRDGLEYQLAIREDRTFD
jgi:predicted transcriptional regulator